MTSMAKPKEDLRVVSASFNVQLGIIARVLGEVDVILCLHSRCFLRSNLLGMIANHTIFRQEGKSSTLRRWFEISMLAKP
jgi:hypothetical protein